MKVLVYHGPGSKSLDKRPRVMKASMRHRLMPPIHTR
jgi:hypothetical protein